MTAIAGLIRLDGAPVDRATLERMQSQLTPYGRDAQRHWHQAGAGLLRTLLRITPEDQWDQQPLHHAASHTVLVFDGRLDNRDELGHELGLGAAELAQLPDSALALQACLRWDTAAVNHLVGDFALACWQTQRQRLWLARDPLGHRPLFWHRQPGFFAFASLPKALFAVAGVPRELCEERLYDFICLLPMVGPESLYKDVYRVEPGHLLVLYGGQISTQRYHSFDPEHQIHLPRDDDYVQAFGEHLDRAVARQLRSSGVIASHLSSGFDSSTVTAVAARLLGQQGKSLLAYTAVPREGYDGPVKKGRHADEGPGARALAQRFANIQHTLIRADGTSPLVGLQTATESMDCAVRNPCNLVWSDAIQVEAARHGAKVLLTGQMGNMTISYTGEEYLPALLGRGQWATWWQEATALKRHTPSRRWRGLLAQSLGPYLPPALWVALQKFKGVGSALTDYTAIHPDFVQRMQSQTRAENAGWDLSYRPWANGRAMRIAVLNRLDGGEHALDANAQGLEVRDPTSDLRLLEFCLAVPDSQYLRQGQTRWLLHRLMGQVLPAEILQAKTKGLQAADWHEAVGADVPRMRAELQRLKAHGGVANYLDLDALLQALDNWPQTGWASAAVIERYRLKLLRGLAVGTFIRHVDPRNT
jgi:asparagine synthase (glutamine-hydrolysing)